MIQQMDVSNVFVSSSIENLKQNKQNTCYKQY